MRKSLFTHRNCSFLAVCFFVLPGIKPALAGGTCACDPDFVGQIEVVDGVACWTSPNGVVGVDDIAALLLHLQGQGPFLYCDGTEVADGLDINCDGVVSQCDFDIIGCIRDLPGDPTTACCEASVCGACCIDGIACAHQSEALCNDAGGAYSGDGTFCAVQNAAIIAEPGGEVFTHVIGPPTDCTGNRSASSASRGGCDAGPFLDAWISPADASMCHNFGVTGSPPIPADFFGPGSDPFVGAVCLQGVPLGDPLFPDADTLIERGFDPFDLPSPTEVVVPIEIVALSLVSITPITVTFNGGQDPEDWDVAVSLSDVTASTGSLTAVKNNCNGGTYTNELDVQPKFTFSKVGAPTTTAILDTGVAGIAPVQLLQTNGLPWVGDIDPGIVYNGDPCSSFHPGLVQGAGITSSCDCNENQIRDLCDIEDNLEPDTNNNGVPDSCEGIVSAIPAASQWGLAILTLFLMAAGTVIIRVRRTTVSIRTRP